MCVGKLSQQLIGWRQMLHGHLMNITNSVSRHHHKHKQILRRSRAPLTSKIGNPGKWEINETAIKYVYPRKSKYYVVNRNVDFDMGNPIV